MLYRIVLAAPPFAISDASLLPGADAAQIEDCKHALAEAAGVDEAAVEAQLDSLLDGEDSGSPNGRSARSTCGRAVAQAQRWANLFGPTPEVVWLLDPWGSMAARSSRDRDSAAGSSEAAFLLEGGALALTLRPEPAAGLLPDAAEEAAADVRPSTWREALQPLGQARMQETSSAPRASLVADGTAPAAGDDWCYSDGVDDGGAWMAHVPAAPDRDDTQQARLAGGSCVVKKPPSLL